MIRRTLWFWFVAGVLATSVGCGDDGSGESGPDAAIDGDGEGADGASDGDADGADGASDGADGGSDGDADGAADVDAGGDADGAESDAGDGDPDSDGNAADAGSDASEDAGADAGEQPDGDAGVETAPLEIRGRWHSNFGGEERFTSELFSSYGDVAIVEYDNAQNWLVTQNPADAAWSPGKFGKIVWTEIADGSFYYCTVTLGVDTAEQARESANTADASALESSGCNGFPWTKLSPALELGGAWLGNVDGEENIDSDSWSGLVSIVDYDNAGNWLITQNAADAESNPSKFNKVVWTEIADNSFYYCTVDTGLDTAAAARESTNTADVSDPENGGCNGAAWIKRTAVLEIVGEWVNNYGGEEAIDLESWSFFGSPVSIIEYDSRDNWLTTQNPADATWSPDKFSKIVWTEITGGSFYYCTVDFGLDTAEAARDSSKTADATDPANGGCGGFPWTKLSPALELSGSWEVGELDVVVSSTSWGAASVVSYDNAANSAITRNPDAGEQALKFNKVVWTELHEGAFEACLVSENQESAELAESAATSANAEDLEAGCNGGPWTVYVAE